MPLSPQVFQILLSLADGQRHGYAIIQDIEARTAGETRLTASTLYAALKRLLDAGLIEESDETHATDGTHATSAGAGASGGPARRYYRLTRAGIRAGRAEAARLEQLASMARERRWLPARRTR